jgi:rubrerythrin
MKSQRLIVVKGGNRAIPLGFTSGDKKERRPKCAFCGSKMFGITKKSCPICNSKLD